MTVKNVFKCRMPSMNYVFSNGKYAQFIEGVFMTDIENEVQELEKESKSGHPFIYIDQDEKTFDTSLQDKMNIAVATAKLNVLREYEANKAESNLPTVSNTASPDQLSAMLDAASSDASPVAGVVIRRG